MIQVVQLRRVLLLFALVLGLSAVVASLAPPPDTRKEGARDLTTAVMPPDPEPLGVSVTRLLRFSVPARGARQMTRRVGAGSSASLEVTVPEPGDVAVDELGLRQTADPLTPARFELLALPPGRYAVTFEPLRGPPRIVGRLEFRRPRRGR